MRVLLVDDSKVIRRMQENQLTELGGTNIIHANDGQEALDVLEMCGPKESMATSCQYSSEFYTMAQLFG